MYVIACNLWTLEFWYVSWGLHFSYSPPPFFFWFVSFFLGWDLCPCSVDLGGPSQCLNFGPTSEPEVNKGLGCLFSSFGCLFQLVFLSVSFCSRQIIPCSLSKAPRHISVGDFPLRCISQGAPPARLHSIQSMSQTPENGLVV